MKALVKVLLLIGVLGCLALVLVIMSFSTLVKSGIETMGPKVLGVPVTLEDVDIELLSAGTVQTGLTRLVIKNPEGYETVSALSLPHIQAQFDWNSVLTDTILVEEVLIVGPVITFEWSLERGSNLSKIQENVTRSTQSGPDDNEKEKRETHKEGDEPEKKVHIKKVTVKDAIINVSLIGGQNQVIQLPLDDFELRDIGNPSEGTTFSNALAVVFDDLIHRAILRAVKKTGMLIPRGVQQLGQSVGKIGKELLKGLFGK